MVSGTELPGWLDRGINAVRRAGLIEDFRFEVSRLFIDLSSSVL